MNIIPDYTHIWNLIDYLHMSNQISNESKLDIFKALTVMESKKQCTLGDLPEDVY